MMVHIPQVLTPEQVAHCRAVFDKAAWEDGRTTAGRQSAQVKKNLQLPEGSPAARELGDLVLAGLEKSPLFISAVLPQRVFPPLFNRYEQGMDFGSHVDNAIRPILGTNQRLRTDVSATLFLSEPDSYDGGELVVEDTYGNHSAKLPAGDLVVYPSTSLHHVTPVTRGVRLASFFWVQSMIRDAGRRALLFDMDTSIMQLTREVPKSPALVMLTGVYHNLLRQWAEP
ncbi:Fe2+-dependent dioxygenase [Corallococcus sp. AS-1-6]|uniref:Fe2+-dependent dioxygenase n=1 Tax=Corallococcus sp. AS-1-6 TaxID=2874599 RepID=UPI001CBEA63F|nr:Fe2+-dependent dioxygenase [Corallococcus sp. AS-1-6]MBZ4376958.1 Fe2+-dependent dioxygenase [Corallococcus sp. AS-1-6]